ncbi:MAG TPA: ATP-binding cassette domain-containing protein, partial [bacterium]|nr:ATP-binding cassette domain-containing protein [bacterium]
MESDILRIENFYAGFGNSTILKNINFSVVENKITSIMGPSGCGKTTLIRCINRLHEFSPGATFSGKILLRGEDIYSINPISVRRKIGMVFQRPNPFPNMSIYDNVISGYILNGIHLSREEKERVVTTSLKKAGLWEEVKDSLHRRG